MRCYWSRLVVNIETLDISQGTVATHLKCGGISSVTVLLLIFSRFLQWNNFENRLVFGRVKAYKNGANFWATLYIWMCDRQSASLETTCARQNSFDWIVGCHLCSTTKSTTHLSISSLKNHKSFLTSYRPKPTPDASLFLEPTSS